LDQGTGLSDPNHHPPRNNFSTRLSAGGLRSHQNSLSPEMPTLLPRIAVLLPSKCHSKRRPGEGSIPFLVQRIKVTPPQRTRGIDFFPGIASALLYAPSTLFWDASKKASISGTQSSFFLMQRAPDFSVLRWRALQSAQPIPVRENSPSPSTLPANSCRGSRPEMTPLVKDFLCKKTQRVIEIPAAFS